MVSAYQVPQIFQAPHRLSLTLTATGKVGVHCWALWGWHDAQSGRATPQTRPARYRAHLLCRVPLLKHTCMDTFEQLLIWGRRRAP